MPKVVLTLTNEQAHRLTILADAYGCDVTELAHELVQDGITHCELAIEREACEQIGYLVNAEPLGGA